ncbi:MULTISPECIES: methylmalonyl-CoA mutase family protein [Bacillaceae]|uniref:methylmalonyl-CoA mutase family protein n=1 Tax=Bacillaceae TaxID=186817 RepID=UPI00159BC79D|nr:MULTISPECIES: methylmalonyl-CoA mutase family protein [Bacillaceae]UGB29406.1 methylmalonyl-CoA mutase family protein [Metabacillus sp. B2-18]
MGDGQIRAENRRELWEHEVEKALRGKTLEILNKATYEGIKIKPLYDETDLKDTKNKQNSLKAKPDRSWKISQAVNCEYAEEIQEKIKNSKLRGQNSFFLRHFQNLRKKEELQTAFKHVDWKNDSIFFDVRNQLGVIPHFLHLRKELHQLKDLQGTIGFDPYEDILTNGEDSLSLSTKLDFLADTIKWMSGNDCNARCIVIKGNVYSEAGANAQQELVYTFSHALEIINELLNQQVPLQQIVNRMTFSFGIGSNFFMEIAKFRAAQHIWTSLLHALGVANAAISKLYLHAVTSTYNKTIFDVHVNLLRTTTESFSAISGGVDELTILPFDSVIDQQSQLGERISRNIHFILQEESLLSKINDPAAGSYYIEALTNELSERVWEELKEIEEKGGFIQQLIEGNVQKNINKIADQRVRDLDYRKNLVIGTNTFANPADQVSKDDSLKPKVCHYEDHTLHYVSSFYEALQFVCKEKTTPRLKSDSIETSLQVQSLKTTRLVEHFEKLRIRALHAKRQGQDIKVGVVTFGELKDYKSRLDYISGILFSGGIDVEIASMGETTKFKQMRCVILCGNDKSYEVINSTFINGLQADNENLHLFITGNRQEEIVNELQLDGMITSNMNVYEFLKSIQNILGVSGN